MQALRAYLLLRGRLYGRLLRELGWLRLLVLGSMLLAAGSNALGRAAQHATGQWAVPVVLLVSVLSAHRQRSDLRFLATVAPGYRAWLAVEYGLLPLPIAVVLWAFGDVGAGLLTVGLAPLAAWLPPARELRSTTRRPRSFFRSEAFEWVSGMRGSRAWLLWPVLLAAAAW